MTSANVIEYRIDKGGKQIGSHRQHLMCKSSAHELLVFQPLSEHTITPYGYDEEEEYWEGDEVNLEKFLRGQTSTNSELKEYFNKN